ncbi:MAG TPA: TIM44-like domain-containing protein, partial [Burkholderiales bacterium]|nr:TIM44-like domain-containing protein [Burkholderiales bacterium]
MHKLLSIIAVLIGFSIVAVDSEAARLGGGRSVGRQSSSATNQSAPVQRAAPTQPATPAAPQPSGMSRWLGPLAGLAAGFGLASLLGNSGLGGAMGSILMVMLLAGVGFFIFRLLTRGKAAQQPPLQYAGSGNSHARIEPQSSQFTGNAATPGSLAATLGGASTPATNRWPADFDAVEFERQALLNFQRVQAANDAGDAATLRDFLTPELYRELEGEMKAAWGAPQKTEAIGVKAEVLEVVTESDLYVVSVRFTGQVREN